MSYLVWPADWQSMDVLAAAIQLLLEIKIVMSPISFSMP